MKILITGGSGFLGRAIVLGHPDNDYVIYSPNVYNQQHLHQAVSRHGAGVKVSYVVGDVRDTELLAQACRGCDAIIHAAAMKYVPEAELNVAACMGVNVSGSEAVIRTALGYSVPVVVGVSTDKACMPVSVYGATKLLMERLFVNAGTAKHNVFHTVRFGNFIGSTGSVIPKMLDQARMTGSITITDPIMTRYWMRAQEVANILIGLAKQNIDGLTNGSVLVPDPPAMTLSGIVTVIKSLISDRLVVNTIGPRPGEKTHELLICHEESAHSVQRDNLIFGGTYYEYHPDITNSTTFKLTSSSPKQWLEPPVMLQCVKEALQLQAAAVV